MCGCHHLTEIIDLGDQYLQGSFVKEGVINPPKRKLPTKLVRCDVTKSDTACGLVQLAHTFPPAVLYTNYWYRSGTNQTMRNHLKSIVDSAISLVNDKQDSLRVLDIGCNDGTLLSYYPKGTDLYGVDPSDIAKNIDFPVNLVNTVFPSELASKTFQDTKFNIVTSIAMFYDLEDPINFSKHIENILDDNGVWIVEMSHMPLMLLQNSFDTICHEHIEYYSLAVLEYIFDHAGLRCFRIELNDINGGSIRCYVCKNSVNKFDTPEFNAFIQRVRLREFELALDTDMPYETFRNHITELKKNMTSLLNGIKQQGGRIHVYGASTKGNVLLQWYGLDSSIIEAAADRNPHKEGGKTLGTNIPIISEEQSRKSAPEYYLVLPWHFKHEFLKREYETIKNGTTFIFPLPNIELVNAKNIDEIMEKEELNSKTSSIHMTNILMEDPG